MDGTKDIIHPLVDLTMPLGMTTVASSVMAPEFGDTKKYSHLIRMNMPSDVVIASFVNVLRYFHWKYVSVVYTDGSENSLLGAQGFEEFKRQTELHGIEIAVEEKIGNEEHLAATMDIIVHRLKIKQNAGARAVVLLLPPYYINHLLSAVKRLQHLGRSRVGDFVWLAYDTLEPFQMFPDQSYSALVMRTQSGDIPGFKDYFTKLDVKNNRRNPWFREYWEHVFNCRGSSCLNGQYQNLQQIGFIQDRSVPNTVNGLFTLALGLDTLQKQLCEEGKGWCPATKNKMAIREKLLDPVKKIRFVGLDGTPILFGDQNYVSRTLDLYHFREVGDVRAFVSVGLIDEGHGLSINSSLTRGYDDQGKLVSLADVFSFCNDSETCPKKDESQGLSLPYMKIPANQEFMIGVMMPVHQPGDNFFTCSRVVEEGSFQNLLALSYALDKINGNATVLPQIQLGALVFDHCGRRQKAEEQIFSFIASDGSLPYGEANLKSRAMVAALTFDPAVADDLSPLFESALIPQIATPPGLVATSPDHLKRTSRSVEQPQERPQVKVIVDLLKRLDWKFVNLLHSGSESDRSIFWNFIESSKEQKICISKSLVVRPDMPVSDLSALFQEEFQPIQEARVIVMLLEEPLLVKAVLDAAKEGSLIEDYVWIGIESDKDGRNIARSLQGFDVDFFLIRPETYEVPGFREYYSNFNLNKHDPIPDMWFEEFWQHHFHCHLTQSISPLKKLFPEPCRGTESLTSRPLNQDTFVYHTVSAVTAVAESLHDYLRRYCVHGDAATNLEDCGGDSRQILWREMRKFMKGPPVACIDGDCGPLKMSVGYQIFQMRKSKIHHVYQQVGLWKDKELSMKLEDIEFVTGAKRDSNCHQQCQKCLDQLAIDPEELNLTKPALYANFRTMWGVIVSALSLLGVLLVIICAAYFLISFQVTVGTTVLGYMILFGLLLLYAVNFAFILSPTEGTCGVRRFGLGLAYAIIFSGMLVKVMNIWRMMGYRGNQFFGDAYHMTSPAALLVVAVGLVCYTGYPVFSLVDPNSSYNWHPRR
ncbi:metabotropic glutamate receptor 7 [Caerostris extrusa]|uniref:Metabotropic glutamate receptor 7 n=1 Tax=Caerostris extrusa TaxID=172846 RepID=A0AAV4QX55_CAEEX|nr:metabotropic glutamate receptor 7 [Caerostris extrusa]